MYIFLPNMLHNYVYYVCVRNDLLSRMIMQP